MEKVKIDNFLKTHQAVDFPEYVSLCGAEIKKIQASIAQKLGFETCPDGLVLVKKIYSLGKLCIDVNAESQAFSLQKTISDLGISALERIYISWYRYDIIDIFDVNIFDRYFDDIWYPGADDIDIFDESLTWIISILHNGQIKLLKM